MVINSDASQGKQSREIPFPQQQAKQVEQHQRPTTLDKNDDANDAELLNQLLTSYLHQESDKHNVALRFQHRINLARAWSIPANAGTTTILDIGCGQGEASLVLAALNNHGSITGIDTAPPGYGGPFTLIEAQAYISKNPLGQKIRFLASDAPSLLLLRRGEPNEKETQFDAAVLCHSLWYFSSTETVSNLFGTLSVSGRVKRVCIAEYTGKASSPDQLPHELACTAQSILFRSKRPDPGRIQEWNVRTGLRPDDYVRIAAENGWRVERSGVVAAPEGMIDGHREAMMVGSGRFREEVKKEGLGVKVEEEVLRLSEDVRALYQEVVDKGGKVRCMDTFWAVLVLDE